jgi:hypothetical protein
MDDEIKYGSIDVKHYRERIEHRRECLGGDTFAHASKPLQVEFGVKVPVGDLEILLECYERMIGDKCRACGADTRKSYCPCENDE